MDTSKQHLQTGATTALDARQWKALLEQENHVIAETGVRVGIVSIDLAGRHDDPERDAILRDRAIRLLSRLIARTDRIAVTSTSSIAVLRAPLDSLPGLERQARDLALQLYGAGLDAAVGFAHRRASEDLMDTWARADAQADRALFRLERSAGGLNLA